MIKITKDNKGITLISLIITVILMLLLVSVGTYTGLNSYKSVQITKFVTQMQLLQTKVDDLVNSGNLNSITDSLRLPNNQEKSVIDSAFGSGEISSSDINNYKVFTQEDILRELDVEDVEDNIMVNIQTGEIVTLTGVEYEGKTYYTQYKLPNGQTIIDNTPVERELEFAIDLLVDGINSVVTAKDIKITNGTLKYKEEKDEYWQTVTNYTEVDKEYKISISKSGNYIFKLQDNAESENSTEKTMQIKLTNKPKTKLELQSYNYAEDSTSWAYIKQNDVNYVWIPRFAYKTNIDTNSTEIKFIKGNSNISTDNMHINEREWIIPSKFNKDDGTKLTGIWVRVDSANQARLDMINILNSDAQTSTEI